MIKDGMRCVLSSKEKYSWYVGLLLTYLVKSPNMRRTQVQVLRPVRDKDAPRK